jgi:hypothetical protein
MPILLAIAAVLLILVLIASALWDRDGDDADDDNGASTSQESTDPTDPSNTDDATTVAPDTTSPDTTSPDTTSAPTTSPATTTPPPTTPATTTPSGGGSGGSGGTGGSEGSGADGGDDKGDGRLVIIEGSTGPCKFGNSCLTAGFRVIGFPSGEKEYVCEFRDGSRYTYKFGARTVEYACATGARGDSITIEVDGVRSATIRAGDVDLSTK